MYNGLRHNLRKHQNVLVLFVQLSVQTIFLVKCDMGMIQERIYDNMAAVVDAGIEFVHKNIIIITQFK